MLHVQQPALLRMTRASVVAVVGMLFASSGGAAEPAVAAQCFELIPARSRIEPPSPMLVDKCTGRSWLLVRSRGSYRWAMIDMDQARPKATDRPVTDNQPMAKDGDGQKCFAFNGRKFCE